MRDIVFQDTVLCRAFKEIPISVVDPHDSDTEQERKIVFWARDALKTIVKICNEIANKYSTPWLDLRGSIWFRGYGQCDSSHVACTERTPVGPAVEITRRFVDTTHEHRVHILVHEAIHSFLQTASSLMHDKYFQSAAVNPFGVLPKSYAYAYNPCDTIKSYRDLVNYYQLDEKEWGQEMQFVSAYKRDPDLWKLVLNQGEWFWEGSSNPTIRDVGKTFHNLNLAGLTHRKMLSYLPQEKSIFFRDMEDAGLDEDTANVLWWRLRGRRQGEKYNNNHLLYRGSYKAQTTRNRRRRTKKRRM